jgi:hypothetical protein
MVTASEIVFRTEFFNRLNSLWVNETQILAAPDQPVATDEGVEFSGQPLRFTCYLVLLERNVVGIVRDRWYV